jgi:hypothetical protein
MRTGGDLKWSTINAFQLLVRLTNSMDEGIKYTSVRRRVRTST